MKLKTIVEELELSRINAMPENEIQTEIHAGYASDLLSDVLAHAPRQSVLVTMQVHMNVVAVALHAEVAAVVFAAGRRPGDAIRRRATRENLPLYGARASTFDLVGRLYELGLRGKRR